MAFLHLRLLPIARSMVTLCTGTPFRTLLQCYNITTKHIIGGLIGFVIGSIIPVEIFLGEVTFLRQGQFWMRLLLLVALDIAFFFAVYGTLRFKQPSVAKGVFWAMTLVAWPVFLFMLLVRIAP